MAAPKKPKSAGVQKGKTKVAAAKSPAANGNGKSAPPAEMIRARAYEIFMARNGHSGDELSDWLAAEREIMATLSSHS